MRQCTAHGNPEWTRRGQPSDPTFLNQNETGAVFGFNSIEFGPAGNFYICAVGGTIHVYKTDGNQIRTFGVAATGLSNVIRFGPDGLLILLVITLVAPFNRMQETDPENRTSG